METENNLGKQIIWSLGIFALIFFWTNILWDYSGELVSRISGSNLASVATPVIVTEYSETSSNSLVSKPAIIKPNIKLAFVGDIMLDRGVKYSVNKNFGGDYAELFTKVKTQLQSYDLLFGNLEGPVSDKGNDGGNIYSFRFEPKIIPVLKDAGFDIVSVANNHIFNWGREAFEDTLSRLSADGLNYVGGGISGSEAYQEKVVNVSGVKIAFIAFSEFRDGAVTSTSTKSGIAIIGEDEIKNSVSRARSEADLVLVSFHFGEEYQNQPNDFQQKYAELAMDSGADLVIGSHPHVVQAVGRYKNAYITYSLGNFIFDQYFSEETMHGGLLEVEVNSSSKLIEKVNLKDVLLNKKYQIESIN